MKMSRKRREWQAREERVKITKSIRIESGSLCRFEGKR